MRTEHIDVPIKGRQIGWGSVAAVALAWLGGCSSESDSDAFGPPWLTPAALVVSDPVSSGVPPAASGARSGVSISQGTADRAYVSLVEGEIPTGTLARIQNWRTGTTLTTPVVAGGFDPVAVEAEAGDTLEVAVEVSSGPSPLNFLLLVPLAAPPIVVRTEPADGKRDVPLNARIIIVFSEPIDGSTLTGTTIRLKRGFTVVSGEVQVADAEQLRAEFVPAEPLDPSTAYELEVTQGIEDLDGEPLGQPVTVSFTTTAVLPPPPPPPPPPPLSGRIAFVSDRDGTKQIYVANADGTGVTRLTNGEKPALSRDGRRIAFHRQAFPSASWYGVEVYVMNADGTGETWLAHGGWPAWSPDGSKIVFSNAGIEVINADGSGLTRLLGNNFVQPGDELFESAWSPDGQRIAFMWSDANWDYPFTIYVMNSDGSNPRSLRHVDDRVWYSKMSPTWSPDGSRIAYVSEDWCTTGPVALEMCGAQGWAIASESLDGIGSRGVHLRSAPNLPPSDADWSPDGLRFAFDMATVPGVESSRIFMVTLATGAVQQMIPDAVAPVLKDYSDREVTWSRGAP